VDPITIFLLMLGVVSLLKKAVKWANWKIGSDPGRIMLEQVYDEQKDRLEHQYEAQQTRIQETATEVSGQQTAARAAMGQAGGEGTAAAGVLAHTEARKTADLGLLDTAYQDALDDLEAQYDLAVQQQSEELAFDIESAVANLGQIGLGSLSLGMKGSRATLNAENILGMENRYYTWGLLE
jgi:t-SNARE complex subunit (syntaxin)